jgi:hypothetical protein
MTDTTTTNSDAAAGATGGALSETGRGFAIASLVLGATSLLAGWVLVAPIVGLVLGVLSRRRESDAHCWATAGIVLNAVSLVGWLLATIGIVAFSALAFGFHFLRGFAY